MQSCIFRKKYQYFNDRFEVPQGTEEVFEEEETCST